MNKWDHCDIYSRNMTQDNRKTGKFGRFWSLLPLLLFVCTVLLLFWGNRQRESYIRQLSMVVVQHDNTASWEAPSWDYVPPATQVAVAINFPAALFTYALTAEMDRPRHTAVFLISVVLLWICVAYLATRQRPVGLAAGALGVVLVCTGSFLAGIAIHRIGMGHEQFVNLCGVLWGVVVSGYAVALLLSSRRLPSSERGSSV